MKTGKSFNEKQIKEFYEGIKNERNYFQPRLNNCRDKNGFILTEEFDVL